MAKFFEIFQGLVVKTFNQVYQFAIQWTPKLALSLIVLFSGWICALLVKKIIAKLLKALGFDVVCEKTGFKQFLEKGGIAKNPSVVIGLGFYWLLVFSAIVMAFNVLELEGASLLVKQSLLYLPKIIVSIIFIALGIFLGQFMAKVVEKTAHLAGIPMYRIFGRITQYVIVGLTLMMTLEYLEVATSIIVEYAVIIFGIVPLVLCLVFLISGRDIVASILAGRLLLKEYKKGDSIAFDSISGEIEAIDLITTKIKSEGATVFIPNSELIKKIIIKKKK